MLNQICWVRSSSLLTASVLYWFVFKLKIAFNNPVRTDKPWLSSVTPRINSRLNNQNLVTPLCLEGLDSMYCVLDVLSFLYILIFLDFSGFIVIWSILYVLTVNFQGLYSLNVAILLDQSQPAKSWFLVWGSRFGRRHCKIPGRSTKFHKIPFQHGVNNQFTRRSVVQVSCGP
jgi:hypothetical protein